MNSLFKLRKTTTQLLVILIAATSISMNGCGKKTSGDVIPYVQVDKYINMTLPGYTQLMNPGGYVVETGGVKGLFIIKNYSGVYQCFDRNCSYKPLDACSVLTVDSSGLLLKCGSYNNGTWTPCCGSTFGIDGVPQQAPATRPLRQYQVSSDGTLLHIFN